MPLSQAAGKALGKLFRNLTNPRWLAEQAAGTATAIFVLNPLGKNVTAYLRGKIEHRPDPKSNPVHVGDVYHCADGHNYVYANGKAYRYDAQTDGWYNA